MTSASVIPNPEFLELVVMSSGKLHYFFCEADRNSPWQGLIAILPDYNVIGNAALITIQLETQKENFELVMPSASGGLLHFERDNSDDKFL